MKKNVARLEGARKCSYRLPRRNEIDSLLVGSSERGIKNCRDAQRGEGRNPFPN